MKIIKAFTFLPFLLLASCSFKMIKIEGIEKPNVEKLGFNGSDITFNIQLHNPNTFGFRLVNSDIKVVANKMEIGFLGLDKKIKIKRNSTTTIPVKLKVDSGKLLSLGAMSLFTDPEILIKGTVKGRKFIITKKYSLEYKDHFSLKDFTN